MSRTYFAPSTTEMKCRSPKLTFVCLFVCLFVCFYRGSMYFFIFNNLWKKALWKQTEVTNFGKTISYIFVPFVIVFVVVFVFVFCFLVSFTAKRLWNWIKIENCIKIGLKLFELWALFVLFFVCLFVCVCVFVFVLFFCLFCFGFGLFVCFFVCLFVCLFVFIIKTNY